VRDAHLLDAALPLCAKRRKVAAFGASQTGREHHFALEHEFGGDGTIFDGGRGGATAALVFEAYVEPVLAPSLRKGPDSGRGELIEEGSCELAYLPAYSPASSSNDRASRVRFLRMGAAPSSRSLLALYPSSGRTRTLARWLGGLGPRRRYTLHSTRK
jgi:hypothetical protein